MADQYLSLAEAAEIAPGQPTLATVWRWARKGVKAANGQTVRLAHVRAGRRIFTTPERLDKFLAATAAADLEHFDAQDDAQQAARASRPDRQRQRDIAAAEARLNVTGR